MKTLRLQHLAIATALGTSALLGVPGTPSAADTGADVQAVLDALVAAGVPEELLDADVQARLAEHLEELVDADLIEPEDLADLREDLVETGDGSGEDAVAERLERGRQRQADYRDAVRDTLAGLKIELEDGQSAREALRAYGYSNDEVRDLLPKRREVRCDVEGDCDKGREHRDHEDRPHEERHHENRGRKHRDRTPDDDPITEGVDHDDEGGEDRDL